MPDRRVLAFVATTVVALAGLFLTMAADKRSLAFTLGVRPTQVAAVLKAGDEACQGLIDVPANAASVQFQAGTFHRPGPPLEVTVRSAGGALDSGRLAGGYADNSRQRVRVGGIEDGRRISVCFRNAGTTRLALYGGAGQAARTSAVFVEGKRQDADITLTFEREQSRSMLSLLPAVFERASLFHATWISSWLLWTMAILVAIVVPLMLTLALVRARED